MMKSAIEEAVDKLLQTASERINTLYSDEEITDFYIRFESESNELSLKDDNDVELSKVVIDLPVVDDMDLEDEDDEDALTTDDEGEDELKSLLIGTLRKTLGVMASEKRFDKVNVFKPFSFVFEDEDEMDDLLIVDDDSLMIGDDLLKDLDEDLDAFMERLLSEK